MLVYIYWSLYCSLLEARGAGNHISGVLTNVCELLCVLCLFIRAEKKLFLDAAVIQQGRLMDANTKLSQVLGCYPYSTRSHESAYHSHVIVSNILDSPVSSPQNEVMGMVTFGAEKIFSSKASTVTDADIDAILDNSAKRAALENNKLQKNMQHNLNTFSLDDNVSSLYEFEGADFSKVTGVPGGSMASFISLPQRERKRNYNVNEYFNEALRMYDPEEEKEKSSKPRSRVDKSKV